MGSCLGHDAPPGSCRGRIVILDPGLAQEIDASTAIVLTEPRYSAVRNYQIILPLFTVSAGAVDNHDLVLPSRGWADVLPGRENYVLAAIPATHSVWHADDIAQETEYVVDDHTLAEIDRRLSEYFSLPPIG